MVEGVVTTAARAREAPPPRHSGELAVCNHGTEVAFESDHVSLVLARLGIANPTRPQRAKVLDTLNKALLQWQGKGGRHGRTDP